MFSEPGESPEGGEEEEYEGEEKKARGPLFKVLVVVLAALLGGVAVWWFAFSNSPPRAAFSVSSVDYKVTVDARNSTDPDGNIATYAWDWGDGAAVTFGLRQTHNYPPSQVLSYRITLTVTDTRGAASSVSLAIQLHVAATADFIARTEQMTVHFDASRSFSPSGGTITAYSWNFGDQSPAGAGELADHTYATPGRYTVNLTVTDSNGLMGNATRLVSPASTTVDVLVDQLFSAGCPYGQFWLLRNDSYGDYILRNSAPCTDYYPWVLYSASVDQQKVNPSWVYTVYRWNALVRNHPGYSVLNPVFLPVFNASAQPNPTSYIQTNFTFRYLGTPEITGLDPTPYRVNHKYSDGFGYLLEGTIQMDMQESRRIFGVDDNVVFSPAANSSAAPAWVNATNGFSSNDVYATSNTNGSTVQYRTYGIPQTSVGSPIAKVEVGLEGKTAGDDGVRVDFSTDGGGTWTTAGTVNFTSADRTTFLDVTSLRTWTFDLLSNTNFRTRIVYAQVGGTPSVVYVDWVPVRVKSDARFWWAANTAFARVSGPLEQKYGSWLAQNGNGKYDIYNGFEWFYENDITDLNATVAGDGTTTVRVFFDGWGLDVLLARWFYWGDASYRDAVCVQGQIPECTQTLPYGAIQPQGWMPMETCWCEHAYINATIRSTLDMDHTAFQEYHLNAWANWGADNLWNTTDDQPEWTWGPLLMDYVPRVGSGSPGAEGYPNSELRWYEGKKAYHASPGSYAYGDLYEYLVAPTRWTLSSGSSLTIVFPRFEIPWYRPYYSTWNPATKLGNYVTFMSNLTLRSITPAGDYYRWDSRAKVMSIAGPHDWGSNTLPLQSEPYIEFEPETAG